MSSHLFVEIPLFIVASLLLFAVPGELIQRFSGFEASSRLGQLAFRLCSGLLVVSLLYLLARRLNLGTAVLFAMAILSLVGWIYIRIKVGKMQPWSRSDLVGLAAAVTLPVVLLMSSHFADFRTMGMEDSYRNTLLSESVFHEGLVNALRFQFPPPSLYAAGSSDFSYYHLNMHLHIEALNRVSGIPVNRLVYWYFPALYFFLLFSLSFAFVRQLGGALAPAVTAGTLVFLSGLSWVPGMLGFGEPEFAWLQFFNAAPFSLYTLNGIIPALAGLFAIILALTELTNAKGGRYFLVLGLLALGCFGLKSSMGLQIAGILTLIGFVFRNRGLSIGGAISLALMLTDQFFLRTGTSDTTVSLQLGSATRAHASAFGIQDAGLVFQLFLFFLVLLLESGIRVLGFFHLGKSWATYKKQRPLILFLLVFFVSGYIFPEFINLGDESGLFNHTQWFAIQAIFASWFLLYFFLAATDWNTRTRSLLLVLAVVVSAPSIAQLLWLKTDSGRSLIGLPEKEVVAYLESTPVDSIVMHPLNLKGPSLASNLAGRQSVLNVFRSFVNETQDLERRVMATQMFFAPQTEDATRQDIFNYYGVTHIYGPPELDERLQESLQVEKVMENKTYAVWQYSPSQ